MLFQIALSVQKNGPLWQCWIELIQKEFCGKIKLMVPPLTCFQIQYRKTSSKWAVRNEGITYPLSKRVKNISFKSSVHSGEGVE